MLLRGDLTRVVAEEWRVEGVVHDARHLNLVHREDHRGRGAVLAERLADLRDLPDVEPHAAEFHGDVGAEKLLGTQCRESLQGKARLVVDRLGVRRHNVAADGVHALEEGGEVRGRGRGRLDRSLGEVHG